MNQKTRESVTQKFEFRNIRPEETDQAVMIEQICFPPNEACSEAHMRERIEKAPELFLVAEEKESGKIAGFLNGLSTNEETFRDEFFTDADLYERHAARAGRTAGIPRSGPCERTRWPVPDAGEKKWKRRPDTHLSSG